MRDVDVKRFIYSRRSVNCVASKSDPDIREGGGDDEARCDTILHNRGALSQRDTYV